MNCEETRQLFSPWLDGKLTPFQAQFFQEHLDGCASCRTELALWKDCSAILKGMGDTVTAPPGFASAVMEQIRITETPVARKRFQWARVYWKQLVAGAAAVAVLALGSVGAKIPFWHWPVQVAEHQPSTSPTDTHADTSDKPSVGGRPSSKTTTNTQPGVAISSAPDAPQASSGSSQGGGHEATPGPRAGTTMSTAVSSDNEARVFLNKERKLTSTLLKVGVDSLDKSRVALQVASSSGISGKQVAAQAVGEHECVVLRFIAPSSKADAFMDSLADLGTVLDWQTETQDVTQRFAETLQQYQSLVAQRENTRDVAERQKLNTQVENLESQLNSWDQEAGQHIVVLWLEKI